MNMQYGLILGIDVIILVVLMAVFFRNKRTEPQSPPLDMQKIKSLEASLKKSMDESLSVSQELLNSFDEKITKLNALYASIESKEKTISRYVEKAEKVIASIETRLQQTDQSSVDPYKMAADLIKQGASPDAVKKRCGLSDNEIDLICRIYKK